MRYRNPDTQPMVYPTTLCQLCRSVRIGEGERRGGGGTWGMGKGGVKGEGCVCVCVCVMGGGRWREGWEEWREGCGKGWREWVVCV